MRPSPMTGSVCGFESGRAYNRSTYPDTDDSPFFAGNYNTYMSTAANPPAWTSSYDPSAFWNIVHSAPNVTTSVQAAVSQAKSRRAGYFYITNAIYNTEPDNPYNVAPSSIMWKAEVLGVKHRV